MPAAPKTLSKRVENAAIATGVIAATFGAVTWAATTNAQAASAPVLSAAASPSLPPAVTVPAPSQTLAGPSEVPSAFAEAATVEAVQSSAAEPAVQPAPEKDPTHLESGWYIPVTKYSMTARFGVPGSWSSGYHTGLDLATNQGRTVRAATAGKVISSKYEGAYGNLVQLKIGPKTEIWMAHLDSVKVNKGDVIEAGDAIGTVGMTGRTSGPHLHLEVRVNGKAKNPEEFLWPTGKVLKRLR